MKIDKRVERLLKFSWHVFPGLDLVDDAPEDMKHQFLEMQRQATVDVWNELIRPMLEDPDVDAIAANSGLTADELLQSLAIRVYMAGMGGPDDADYARLSAGTNAYDNSIQMEIGYGFFEHGNLYYAYTVLIHELGHLAESIAGLLPFEPEYDISDTSTAGFLDWLLEPHELIAIRGQILDFINDGWNEEQIIGQVLGNRIPEGATPEEIDRAVEAIEREIRSVRATGPVRVENY